MIGFEEAASWRVCHWLAFIDFDMLESAED